MRLIINPSRDGCTIYSEFFFYTVRGDPSLCCEWIYERVTDPNENTRQIHDISIDPFGIGGYYVDYLKNIGLHFDEMRPMKPFDLPNMHRYNIEV